jgi:putative ABC transport system permease protein
MFRVIAHGLLARKFRLFATALAVTLGVAFMAGTMVLTDTIGHTFDNLSSGVYKGTDAEVRAKATFSAPAMGGGDQRPLISASLVQALRHVPGVTTDEGSVLGYARLIGKNGKAIGNPAGGAPTLGGNWNQVSQLNPWTLVAGHPPRAADQVVIDKQSATTGHLRVGDMTTVLALGPPQRFRVVGIIMFGSADSPGGASVALFTTPVAQRLAAAPGKLTSVLFVASPGVSQQQLASNLRRALPPGLEAVTGATITKELQNSFQQGMSFFNTFMMIFAVIALLVGGFMIFNTFSITVAQRTRENGLLRAVGASKRQVLGSVLAEAVAVGIVASAIGLAAGIAVATALKALLTGLGFGLPAGGIVFSARTVIVAGLAGLAVTVVAAVSPARKAGKVPPVAAMQEVPAGSSGYGSKQRIMVGTGILVLGMAALFTGLFGHIASNILVVGLGVLLVFFGVSVLGRTVSLPLSRVVGAPLPWLRSIAGKLARENAMRNPKRTAASASALMIGVGLVSFITILTSSTNASINSAVDRSFAGDIVIDSGAGLAGGGIDPALAQRLNSLPQVSAATGVGAGIAKVFGKVEQMSAVDPRTAGKIFHVSPQAGAIGALGLGDIAVYKDVATAHHLRIGSPVPVLFRDAGRRTLRVALIYGDATAAPAPRYFLGTPSYHAYFALHYDSKIVVQKAPGVSTTAALAAVRAVAARYSGTSVMDQTAFKAALTKPYNNLLTLVYALLALAILIALLGIGNTLALSIYERTRELGVMRAVGMTRRQLRASIRWESAIIALQGTLLGLLVGVFFGWALVLAMKNQGITVFSLPVMSLVIMVVLAGLAGVVAAILPSRRAAKLNILRAIVSE